MADKENVGTATTMTDGESTSTVTTTKDGVTVAVSGSGPSKADRKPKAATRAMTDSQLDAQIKRMGADIAKMPRFKVRLPKNPMDDPNDQVQYVGINGRSFYIPRGVDVMLPQCVIDVLKQVDAL